MSYNFLRDAKYIGNSVLCRYDSIYGYTTDFSTNGDVNGWDIYNNIYMYGVWNNVLFGSTYLSDCHISRTEVFLSVNAEKYFFIEFVLKVVDENPQKTVPGLTKGKVMWMRTDDSDWADDRTIEFEITKKNEWQYYKLNLGPYKWWQGDINNLRFYPFIDGHEADKFFLKSLRITSEDTWMCTNSQCSYYQFYEHPCPGAGQKAYCEAKSYKNIYNTVSGTNSELLLNIDDYGIERIELGSNTNITGNDIVKVIGNSISTINIGGYSYSEVFLSDDNTIRISSGTSRSDSSVSIEYSPAAEELGFFTDRQEINYIISGGQDPATGFDYASTRLLQTFELNALLDGSNDIAYVHNPTQFSVEGGRRDFNEIGTSKLVSELTSDMGLVSFDNTGKTIIDMSKRIDNNGKLTHFWVYGIIYQDAAFKVLRPHNDGSFTVIYSTELIQENPSMLYTKTPIVSSVECDILVNKGDLLGVYNVDIYVGQSLTGLPDATFTQFPGNIEGRITPTQSYSYGVGGFALYARGDLRQNNTMLDIDLGYRLNVSEFSISGEELEGYFEFNIASCLDVTWQVDLFGATHDHWGYYTTTGYSWHDTHTNIYYGKECLDDLIITADNGQVGESTSNDSNGLGSYGGNHSYFYVNGDSEWIYSNDCSDISEYCGSKVPQGLAYNYQRDPIAFTLYFPNEKNFEVYKSIMYFKEENNFRKIYLSTYVDPYYFRGNADLKQFNLVPSYNYIGINGTMYQPGDNNNIDGYLFHNPTTDDLYSQDYDDQEKVADHFSTYFVDWNILTHEFDPIDCKGFRIYCNKHNSTKITELEVYSRVENDVSMVDNAILYFSDYNELWRTTGFEVDTDTRTKAFIGGTPRYFRLTLESQTLFNMRELAITVTDQTFLEEDVVLLNEARSGVISKGQPIKIINTYDRPFDLTVNIPRDLGMHSNIVLWNTLNSEEALSNTEYGPTCLLYKNEDFPLTYYRGQCAVDSYTYGLANLVHGKEAYYTYNTFDWRYYGTLASGINVGFDNHTYLGRSKFVGPIGVISSKYWRFQAITADIVFKVSDIIVHFLGERAHIKKVLFPYTRLNGLNYMLTNGIEFSAEINYKDTFDEGVFGNLLLTGSNNPSGEVIDNNYLRLNANSGTIVLSTFTFNNTPSFEFFFEYELDDASDLNQTYITWEFYNGTTRLFYLRHWVTASTGTGSCSSTNHQFAIYVDEVQVFYSNSLGCHLNALALNTINIRRAGGFVSVYLTDNVNYVTTFFIDPTASINKYSFTCSGQAYVNIYKILVEDTPLLAQGVWLGLELADNTPLDTISIISSGNTLELNSYTSYNNTTYFFNSITTTEREDLAINFAIDLTKRHDLHIVRHYGLPIELFDISLYLNTTFSNTPGDIEDAIFDSTFEDCRWLNILIICSDSVYRTLNEVGVYPNISTIYCQGGGLNCSWESISNGTTKNLSSKNIAYNATVSGTTYYKENIPDFAVDGITQDFVASSCWGFEEGSNPVLYIEFDDIYRVGSCTIHAGYEPDTPYSIIKAYRLSLDNTEDGSAYIQVMSNSGLGDNAVRNYEFDYTYARRAKFEITDFETMKVYEQQANDIVYNDVAFFREIEIFALEPSEEISSEDYPIICINLRDSFNVVDHKLFNDTRQPINNYSPSDPQNNEWDNDDSFFKYADSLSTNPNVISFISGQDYVTEYETTSSTGDMLNLYSYTFDTSVYLDQGIHYIEWEAYYPQLVGEISVDIFGSSKVSIFADNYGSGWIAQSTDFFIDNVGYFNIYARQNLSDTYNWGVRNIKIYRRYGLTRWVAIERDTASNYSYDFNNDKNGPDYLGKIEVYGDKKYNLTEYSWWWDSDLATLSNNSIFTKVGQRSLQVDYPTSSGIDILRIKEADTMGRDYYWAINDSLSFWVYIDNIYNLDTTFGQVTIGALTGESTDYYYSWNISDMKLETGWNEVSLTFDEYASIYPTNINLANAYLPDELNIQKNLVNLTSLYIKYRGVGNSFTMYFDDFRIRRNKFDTYVKYGNGLCLTYSDYLMIPLSNVTLDKGSVEFWVKMGVNSLSMDAFGNLHAATLFTISSNTNDVIAVRVKPGNWFEIFAGNIRKQTLFSVADLPTKSFVDRGEVIHIGLVWSNDGRGTDSNQTIQLYINGVLTLYSFSTWEVSDTKLSYFKLGGGIAQTAQMYGNHSAFIFENVKIYNYCKKSFEVNKQDIEGDLIYAPENFIEISKDNINYYGLGSENLPLVFEQVPSWDSETVYVRAIKNSKFSATNSTAQIIIDWLTTV
jgi:hypothetical protein